ncbi:beta-1,3-galactosyl-O-glycosyl-glycoprotein beta-1,6-N-acetylglucosaminyltransferase 3-like isoform X1 [Montipora capricornis]|uniref:beta-1,3-galactosyl-O-glycosyl-glycoprotein beta-1,6-N-acetylglucosaminyltransferase 3-like isoform X1 n=2 Tax=Montipora capricornis TaxID=246305 RepID=UPI0035F1A843
MALLRAKIVILVCFSFVVGTFLIIQQSGILRVRRGLKRVNRISEGFSGQWRQFTAEEKELKWKRCKKLIAGQLEVNKTTNPMDDSEILTRYETSENCYHVLRTRFPHPVLTKEEKGLPIAFSLTVYKKAGLLERLLQAVYMPNNIYCIHIDIKSPDVFRKAIQAMIRCLPNVFISRKSADVVWGHFSIVQAQLYCTEELLKSSVDWKYHISLIGQDFPLYDNNQIVAALRMLNDSNSIESFPIPEHNKGRTTHSHTLVNHQIYDTGVAKSPPPHNITIYKGSTHIVATKEFMEFVVHSKIGKDFTEFLKDAYVPDEILYASLQQHPLAPGGIRGEQPEYIPRALHWADQYYQCYGEWVRTLCWLSIKDLQWALGSIMRNRLFVHKIPFDFYDDTLECLLVARQGRKYGSIMWNEP